VTPSLSRSPEGARLVRGDEEQAWLAAHPAVTSFAIVDDDDDMARLGHFTVRTTMVEGLRREHSQALLAAFGASASVFLSQRAAP
jgi:hypothetical protein